MKQNPQRPHDFEAGADDALAAARNLPPGRERIEALKAAGRLRNAADVHGLIVAKRRKSPRDGSQGKKNED